MKIGTIKVLGSALYQWELGRKVQIFLAPDMRVAAVQFAHMGDAEALNVEPREENGIIVADIPNILLQSGQKIAVFLVDVNENKVETTTHAVLPVIPRPRPTDYVYTETEVLSWQALEARVIAFMDEMNEAREAGDFNGDSAYEIAVKYGYEGTEEEWIADLYGKAEEAKQKAEQAQNVAERCATNALISEANAGNSATRASEAEQNAVGAMNTAVEAKNTATAAAQEAKESEINAADSEHMAMAYWHQVSSDKNFVKEAANNAAKSEENAKAAQDKAEEAKVEADNQRRMAAENSVLAGTFMDEALRYRNDALNYMVASDENRRAALTAASNAQSHQQGAETARSQASTYAQTAASSADKAEGSATAAAQSEAEAKQAAEEAKNAGGSGIEVTAKPGQLIRVKETDENGKPTAWEAVPWGWMENTVVLPETTIDSGNLTEGFKRVDQPVGLKVGETYIVTLNGKEYVCVAHDLGDVEPVLTGVVYLGNFHQEDLAGNDEPFCITSNSSNVQITTPSIGDVVSIKHEVVHKLPGNFLPDSVPCVEDVMKHIPVVGEWSTGGGDFTFSKPFLEVGKKYFVTWERTGVVYEDVARVNEDGAIEIGEDGTGTQTIEYPFWIVQYRSGYTYLAMANDGQALDPFSIKVVNEVPRKLDPDLLPDSVPVVKETVLLEEARADSFTHPSFGKMWAIYWGIPNLKAGQTYTVTYNGTPYKCVCQAAPAGLIEDPNAVAMGNFSVVGGANTGEPFAMLVSFAYQEVDIIDLVGSSAVKVKIHTTTAATETYLTSPNGTIFKITVSDSGTITATEV